MSEVASNGIHHHSNLLIGTPEAAETYLKSFCDNLEVKLANNPDFFAFRMPTFGIDEARELSLLSARKALIHHKIFFITSSRLTLEAQNALLKTFEDPFPDTYFFLVAREEALIIPTLLSRMQAIRVGHGGVASVYAEAERFLSLPIKDRLLFAKKFVEDEGDLPIFLDDLLLLLRQDKKSSKLLKAVYDIRRVVSDFLVSPRLVIEHLSLVL